MSSKSSRRANGASPLLLGSALALLCLIGCQQYAPVSSQEGMQVIKRLCTICNARDRGKLNRLEKDLDEFAKASKITPSEKQAFDSIIAQARSGDWEQAEKAAMQFAEDQVGNVNVVKKP